MFVDEVYVLVDWCCMCWIVFVLLFDFEVICVGGDVCVDDVLFVCDVDCMLCSGFYGICLGVV